VTSCKRPAAAPNGSLRVGELHDGGLHVAGESGPHFESPELARLYFDASSSSRQPDEDEHDQHVGGRIPCRPAMPAFACSSRRKKQHGQSSVSIETIVATSMPPAARSFSACLRPTDLQLRQACFAVGDSGKMMFAWSTALRALNPPSRRRRAGSFRDQLAALELFHRSRDNMDTIGAEFFSAALTPAGFETEINIFPGENPRRFHRHRASQVHRHRRGDRRAGDLHWSANMSGNSVFNNDENLLEIKGSPRWRRSIWPSSWNSTSTTRAGALIKFKQSHQPARRRISLRPDRSWADKHYTPGSPEFKARLRMLSVG